VTSGSRDEDGFRSPVPGTAEGIIIELAERIS
jgi:hypothetical protein